MRSAIVLLLVLIHSGAVAAPVEVTDDAGDPVRLSSPAKRIVSLSPHLSELLFAAGAGAQIAAVVAHSDYPADARALPSVGSYDNLDLERVLGLQPDLIVAWQSGNASHQVERLRALGMAVYVSEPRDLGAIAATIERLGVLTGNDETARPAAAAFRSRVAALQARYAGRPPVTVFYQVWNSPLFTVNGEHLISGVMSLCGGRNVFERLPALSAAIDREAVIAANPEAIVASGMDQSRPEWLDEWRRYPQLTAVRRGNLFFVPPDLLQRHTPRVLEGAERLCVELERARERRPLQ